MIKNSLGKSGDVVTLDPRSMSNTDATRLGLKVYLASHTGGANDIAYNGGFKATLTSNMGGHGVDYAYLTPYLTQSGVWKLKFKIAWHHSFSTGIAVIHMANTVNQGERLRYSLALGESPNGAGFAFLEENAMNFYCYALGLTVSGMAIEGECNLAYKPVWAY